MTAGPEFLESRELNTSGRIKHGCDFLERVAWTLFEDLVDDSIDSHFEMSAIEVALDVSRERIIVALGRCPLLLLHLLSRLYYSNQF